MTNDDVGLGSHATDLRLKQLGNLGIAIGGFDKSTMHTCR